MLKTNAEQRVSSFQNKAIHAVAPVLPSSSCSIYTQFTGGRWQNYIRGRGDKVEDRRRRPFVEVFSVDFLVDSS